MLSMACWRNLSPLNTAMTTEIVGEMISIKTSAHDRCFTLERKVANLPGKALYPCLTRLAHRIKVSFVRSCQPRSCTSLFQVRCQPIEHVLLNPQSILTTD